MANASIHAARKRRRGRERGVLLAVAAICCGLLAAARVHEMVEEVESRTGKPVEVVVAGTGVAAGTALSRRRVARVLVVREVPARYAPRDRLGAPGQAVGLETAVDVAPGAYVTTSMLRDPAAEAAPAATSVPVRPGQRLVEVAVSGGRDLGLGGVERVDVLVTTEGATGRGRTFVALENVELVDARPARTGESADADGTPADTIATLRVGARPAVFLTAAQNFAREVRLLARPPGDRNRVGRAEVGDGRL